MTPIHEQAPIVDWLARPGAYPHAPQRVEMIETHISRVFLAGPYVYKLKKPVCYDFLDFSTPEARERASREELRLNRRLAPAAYVDVVPITRQASGEFQLGGTGPAIDWLVQMHRLPTDQTLEAIHRQGELRPEHLDRLARVLTTFYQNLPPLPLSPEEYRSRYVQHVRGNQRELLSVSHHLPPHVVQRVHGFQLQLLRLRPEVFDERIRRGRIVDGHGDLRPEHICLTDPPVIFDCIEFSPEFRTIDVADELAFLATECDFLNADWAGERVWQTYQQRSGDRVSPELFSFYKAYRACVRAKVAALRADQLEGPARETAATEARKHLELADRYAIPWVRPLVLLVGGLSGTGKTTLAAALSEALGAELLRTDLIRQQVFGLEHHAAATDDGIYRPEARRRVYEELFLRGAELHAERVSVVLDGTFSTVQEVRRAQQLAADPRAIFFAIECVCRPEVARERIARRLAAGRDASEARPEIHDVQQQRWEHWPADFRQSRVDTEQPLDKQVQQIVDQLAHTADYPSTDCCLPS